MGIVLPIVSAALLTLISIAGIFFFFRNRRNRLRSTISYDSSLPQPKHYLLAGIYLTGLAVATAFLPFEFRQYEQRQSHDILDRVDERRGLELLGEHEAKFSWPVTIFGNTSYLPANSSDWLGNLLFAIPIAYLWMAVFLVDAESRIGKTATIILIVLAFTALRIILEYAQTWILSRVVSQGDVVAQSIGIALGTIAWLIAGQRFTDWIRSKTIDLRPLGWFAWLLVIYFLAFLVFTYYPLDFTIRGADLARKFRDKLIWFIPYTEPRWQPKLLLAVLTYTPVGMLLASGFLGGRDRVRPLGGCLFIGGIVVACLELSQIFVMHREMATADVFNGLLGVFVGWVIIYIFLGSTKRSTEFDESQGFLSRIGPYLLAATGYAVVLFVLSCSPFAPIADQELIHVRYMAFYQLVIDSGRFDSDFEAILHMVRKALMFAPLGALLAMTAVGPTIPTPIRGILLSLAVVVATAVAFSIEMLQVYLPSHISDIMDVVWCTAGAMLGTGITAYLAIFRGRKNRLEEGENSFA